jgi:hypothetical protein
MQVDLKGIVAAITMKSQTNVPIQLVKTRGFDDDSMEIALKREIESLGVQVMPDLSSTLPLWKRRAMNT